MTVDLSDRVAFAREVLGLDEIYDHQARALRSAATFVVIPGGRRSGKSVAAQIAALHTVTTRRDAQWILTGPNSDKVAQAIDETADLLRRSDIAHSTEVDEQVMRLDIAGTGSAVIGLPPTGGQLRGFGRHVYGAHVEEAGHCPPSVWRDLRYVLADHMEEGAQGWLTGSPWGGPEHFFYANYRLGRDGDPDFFADEPWTSTMNPRLPKDWLSRERARLNSREAAAELDGIWMESGAAFFSREVLDAAVADVDIGPPDTVRLYPVGGVA